MTSTTAHDSSISGPSPEETLLAAANTAATANQSADSTASAKPVRRRIPLSVPRRKLEVPPGSCPGFVLYWFLQSNVPAAIDAGYDFVHRDEISLNQTNPANSADSSGNTDLGSRVSVLGTKSNEMGQPEQLVLMKIPEAWWKEDRQPLDERNASIIHAIFGEHAVIGSEKMDPQDKKLVYVKASGSRLLNRALPKRA